MQNLYLFIFERYFVEIQVYQMRYCILHTNLYSIIDLLITIIISFFLSVGHRLAL